MAINDFVPFATGAGANVYSTQTYQGLNARQIGVVDGEADPKIANNTWRQASVMASAIGAFIADNGFDALDNGDLAALTGAFKAALAGQFNPSLVHYGVDSSTSANSVILSSVSPALNSLTNGTIIVFVPAITNTSNVVAQITVGNTAQATPITARNGVNLSSGDMLGGRPHIGIIYGGALRILTALASEFITTIVNSGQVVIPRDQPTLWVRPDGNDGNDGSANDSAHAFQTIGGALRTATSRYAFSNLFIRLGVPSTYVSPQYVPTTAGTVNIIGDITSQSSYVITGPGSPGQGSFQISSPVNLTGVTIINTGTQSHTVAATNSAQLALFNVSLVTTNTTSGAHAYGAGGRISFTPGCTIQGNASAALYGEPGGDVGINPGTALSVVGTPNFSIAFAVALNGGRVTMLSGAAIVGNSTGTRYNVQNYGIIQTNGGGPNFFPGDQPGFNSNGLYL